MTGDMEVGFSQRVRLEWLECTAQLALQGADRSQIQATLQDLLHDQVSVGGTAVRGNREKVITILLRIWVTPTPSLRPLRDEALAHLQSLPEVDHLVLHWGMVTATYPFFGTVAESVGRLLRLQGAASAPQVQRRLREQLGERETVARAARRILRSFLDWGVLKESRSKGVYQPTPTRPVTDPRVSAWLIEAVLRARGSEAASLRGLAGSPALFPFEVGAPRRDALEGNGRLEFFHQGVNEEMVLLRRTG
jgi:hypothetical protein